jgi:hypothetical protein
MSQGTWMHPVAWSVALALASPAAAAAPSGPRHATVEIDTSDIGEEGPVIKRRTHERTDVVLRAAGVLPGRPDARDPVIHVDVDVLAGPDPGYQCEVWISRDDAVLGERRRVECPLCTESEIVQRVEATVRELVALLPADADAEPSPEPEPSATSGSTPPSSSTPAPPSDTDDRAGLGPLGKAGAALVPVGAAAAIAGAVLVALPAKVDQDDPLYEIDYRPPGAATLAAGGAVLVAGVVLLVVDRRRARPRTTALAPTLGPRAAGLSWSGRF